MSGEQFISKHVFEPKRGRKTPQRAQFSDLERLNTEARTKKREEGERLIKHFENFDKTLHPTARAR